MASQYQPVTPDTFVSPLPTGNFFFVSAFTIFPYTPTASSITELIAYHRFYDQKVFQNGSQIWSNEYHIYGNAATGYLDVRGDNIGYTLSLQSGQTYKVEYVFDFLDQVSSSRSEKITATYEFTVVDNKLPLKKWTITGVINRTLDLAEPIRLGETPRFKLNEEQAAMFDNVLAPQFSFTKQTLRECLQECGKVIHGEPQIGRAHV